LIEGEKSDYTIVEGSQMVFPRNYP